MKIPPFSALLAAATLALSAGAVHAAPFSKICDFADANPANDLPTGAVAANPATNPYFLTFEQGTQLADCKLAAIYKDAAQTQTVGVGEEIATLVYNGYAITFGDDQGHFRPVLAQGFGDIATDPLGGFYLSAQAGQGNSILVNLGSQVNFDVLGLRFATARGSTLTSKVALRSGGSFSQGDQALLDLWNDAVIGLDVNPSTGHPDFIDSIKFSTNGAFLAIDSLVFATSVPSDAGNGGTAPEPASWALLLVAGLAARRMGGRRAS